MIFRRVANIERMTGDWATAVTFYTEAESLLEKLVADTPESIIDRNKLAELESDFAEGLSMASRYRESLGHYARALELIKGLYAGSPGDPELQRTFARIQTDYAVSLFSFGRTAAALECSDRAVDLFAGLAARQPLLADYDPLLLLVALVTRAPMLCEMGRISDAEKCLDQAVNVAQSLIKKNPDSPDNRYYLAAARYEQASIYVEMKRNPLAAQKTLEEALDLLTVLTKSSPQIAYFQSKRAEVQSLLGAIRARLGRSHEALDLCNQARATFDGILAASPQDIEACRSLARTLERLAQIRVAQHDQSDAKHLLKLAAARQEVVVRTFPENEREKKTLKAYRE
jgi:tetratricopeptide (TPR) repeat protein